MSSGTTIKANKKFILSNDGIIEYKTTQMKNGYATSIYFISGENKYKVNPLTFSSITSNLDRFLTTKNGETLEADTVPCVSDGDTCSVFYNVKG